MRQAALAATLLGLATTAAHAHTVIPGIGGFTGGLLHPLLVPAHALALIGLGLLVGTFSPGMRPVLLGVFAAAAVAAFGCIAMAMSAAQAETLVLALAAATGALLATGFRPPVAATTAITAAVAATVTFDSVPQVLTVAETALSLIGTTLTAGALVAAAAWLSAALPEHLGRLGIRLAGSWIAASAILVLALRIAG